MRIWQFKTPAVLLAIAGLCGPALASPSAGSTSTSATPVHHATALPAALRPAFYQALDKNAGTAYSIGKNGCATLPKSPLKACFDRHGAHFSGAGALALRLAAYGRSNQLVSIKPVKPVIKGNRVSYPHGTLTAWWHVLPVGFEQGFTIAKRPAGHGKLTLALATSRQGTGAPPTRHSREKPAPAKAWGGNPAEHTLARGNLRYGKLVVTDAKGKVIPSSLKIKDNRILIALNDARATYPLTIDPLVWIEQKVTASDGAPGEEFGAVIALSSTTALIATPFATVNGNIDQGAAYVFTESEGTWSETAKLTASTDEPYDYFGWSVALDNSTAIIGAFGTTINGTYAQGAAYVFTESGGTWTQSARLTASDGVPYDLFGMAVAISGSTALIGAIDADVNGSPDQGAAYVFTESNGTWAQSAKLTAGDVAASDGFGRTVALDGTAALVGAPYAGSGAGAVYAFSESNGTWTQDQKLVASDGEPGDYFGWPVTLDATTALIGAGGSLNEENAAYVFNKSGGSWVQTQKLTASDGAAGDCFGCSIALDGKRALIGASGMTVNGQAYQGAAYMFRNMDGTWTQTRKFVASDGEAYDQFGAAVALDGTTPVVGAPCSNYDPNTQQCNGPGAAYFESVSDLDLAVSAPETAQQGQQYVSQTIATNNASEASPAVAVTIAVPAAASFVSANATQGVCSEDSSVVTCDFGAIDGNAGTATASVTLKATGDVGATIKNRAGIARATPPLTASAPTVIEKPNSPPVAEDGTLTTQENTSASDTLKATDPDGDPLLFIIVDKPKHGIVAQNAQDTSHYTYTPDQGYSGSDSFTFKASDGQADSNKAAISITVKAAPPPPPSGGGGGGATGPLGLGLLALAGLLALLQRRR